MGANRMLAILENVESYATVDEFAASMRDVSGEYQKSVVIWLPSVVFSEDFPVSIPRSPRWLVLVGRDFIEAFVSPECSSHCFPDYQS